VYPGINLVGGQGDFDVYVTLMLILTGFLLSSIIDAVLLWYGLEMRPKAGKNVRDVEVFPFVRNVVKIAILAISAVFILNRLGFETAAIITGLGVGGIAIALALQDTLGNFFGGLHILMDKPAREEDYVRLENGLEGTVKQIGWRTTRILTTDNNEVIVPNSKLAGSILQNYSTPNDMSAVTYTVGVGCREDVDRVEKAIVAALHRVAKKDQLMDGKSTWARFDSFGDYSLNFKFGYMVRGYVNRFGVLKEVNRELFYAFRKEGISIPYPTRTVYQVNPEAGR
jgi:small-conductance mechanosensitive channel